jgi:CrcB protein
LFVVHVLLVGIGGFAGAVARWVVDGRISAWTGGSLPWGTFAVNVSGSFFVGLLFALVVERATLPTELRGPLMIGFLGAYTTFSTLALESWRMIEDGAWLYASANLVGSVIVGVVAVVIGVALGRAI